jgi:hypothetical protein
MGRNLHRSLIPVMAKTVAERLVERPAQSGFVVMRKPVPG